MTRGAVPAVDIDALERRLAEAGRSWLDRVEEAATALFGDDATRTRLRRLTTIPVSYQVRTTQGQAIADLPKIEAVLAGSPLEGRAAARAG